MDAEAASFAAYRGDAEALRAYLAAGLDPDATDEDGTTLAEVTRSAECLRVLAEYGATLTHLIHRVTIGCDDPPLLRVLLDLGVPPDTPDAHGWTPLHLAAAYGYTRSAALLLARGADPEARTHTGLTPETIARRNGHPPPG